MARLEDMRMSEPVNPQADPGPRAGSLAYVVSVEGVEHPWPSDTISYEDIVSLGGWAPGEGVIEVDEENRERTLRPGEPVQLKPGHAFSKKVRWRRG
jgi:hypothetical protein